MNCASFNVKCITTRLPQLLGWLKQARSALDQLEASTGN